MYYSIPNKSPKQQPFQAPLGFGQRSPQAFRVTAKVPTSRSQKPTARSPGIANHEAMSKTPCWRNPRWARRTWYGWWTKSCTTKDDDYPIVYLVGGWTQPPLKNMLVKLETSPNRGEHKKCLKPPPRPDLNGFWWVEFLPPQKIPAFG